MDADQPSRSASVQKNGGKVLSPSDVALNMGKHSSLFSPPKSMDESEIQDVIQRFTTTAVRAEQAALTAWKYTRPMVICWRNFYLL